MSSYTVMPSGAEWFNYEHIGGDEQTIYSLNAHWFSSDTPIAIRNNDTRVTRIFTRKLDSNGKLLEVIEH